MASIHNEPPTPYKPTIPEEPVSTLDLEQKSLHEAIEKNDCDAIEKLLSQGADPNKVYRISIDYMIEQTPLHCAARYGYTSALELLLEHGAVVNARDSQGRTPLHTAVISGKPEVVKILLDLKADLEMEDGYARTPMHSAAYLGDTKVIKLLLEQGAKVNPRDHDRATPLHIAIDSAANKINIEDWLNTAELLIAHGADTEATNTEGEIPLALAPVQHHTRFAELVNNASQNVVQKNKSLSKTKEEHIQVIRQWVCALSRGIPAVSGGSFMGQKPRPYRELIDYVIAMEKEILTPSQGIEKIRNTLRSMGLGTRFKNECGSAITALSTLNDIESHRRKLSLR